MTDYNAQVEWKTRDDIDAQLMTALDPYSPAIARSERGWVEAYYTLPADNLRQAITTALAVAEAAAAAEVLSIEVLPTAEFDARNGVEDAPETIGVPEAAEILGVSPQAVRQRLAAGSLPARREGRDWRIQRAVVEQLARR